MTHISSIKTKKAFKQAVTKEPSKVSLNDPSMFSPISGSVVFILERKGSVTATNHPKRSWFASISVKNGKTIVT